MERSITVKLAFSVYFGPWQKRAAAEAFNRPALRALLESTAPPLPPASSQFDPRGWFGQ